MAGAAPHSRRAARHRDRADRRAHRRDAGRARRSAGELPAKRRDPHHVRALRHPGRRQRHALGRRAGVPGGGAAPARDVCVRAAVQLLAQAELRREPRDGRAPGDPQRRH